VKHIDEYPHVTALPASLLLSVLVATASEQITKGWSGYVFLASIIVFTPVIAWIIVKRKKHWL